MLTERLIPTTTTDLRLTGYEHLSVCVICHTSERSRAMTGLLSTLPTGVELCIVFNEQGDTDSVTMTKEETLPNGTAVRFAEATWTEFSFAHMRNQALDLATREWILWIDADELVNIAQHSVLQNLVNVPTGCGALMVTVAGLQPSMYEGDETKYFAVPQPRLIRNNTAFRFEGHCHEQVMWSIQRAGYTTQVSTLVITHTGYVVDCDTMIRKMTRNVSLLVKQVNEGDSDDLFFSSLLHRDLGNLLALKGK